MAGSETPASPRAGGLPAYLCPEQGHVPVVWQQQEKLQILREMMQLRRLFPTSWGKPARRGGLRSPGSSPFTERGGSLQLLPPWPVGSAFPPVHCSRGLLGAGAQGADVSVPKWPQRAFPSPTRSMSGRPRVGPRALWAQGSWETLGRRLNLGPPPETLKGCRSHGCSRPCSPGEAPAGQRPPAFLLAPSLVHILSEGAGGGGRWERAGPSLSDGPGLKSARTLC